MQVDVEGQQTFRMKDNFELGSHVLSLEINGQPMTIQVD